MVILLGFFNIHTVKPVFGGHHSDKEKVAFKIGDLLKEIKFIWNFYDRTKKGYLLTQVAA